MRTVLEGGQHTNLGRHRRVARDKPRFHLVDIVSRLEAVAENQTVPQPEKLNPVFRIPAFVLALDDRDFYRQEPSFTGLAVEKTHDRLVMARHRANCRDYFFIRNFLGRAQETGVATIHQNGPITFSIASQRRDQLPPFRVVERTEIHDVLLREKKDQHSLRMSRRQLRQQQVNSSIDAGFLRIGGDGLAVT